MLDTWTAKFLFHIDSLFLRSQQIFGIYHYTTCNIKLSLLILSVWKVDKFFVVGDSMAENPGIC